MGTYEMEAAPMVQSMSQICHPLVTTQQPYLVRSLYPRNRTCYLTRRASRWLSGKEFYQYRSYRFSSRVGKILWRRAWQPTPVFLPGESHGQRSLEGNGNPPQYSCLENPMDRKAWQATVHGVAKGWTQLSY